MNPFTRERSLTGKVIAGCVRGQERAGVEEVARVEGAVLVEPGHNAVPSVEQPSGPDSFERQQGSAKFRPEVVLGCSKLRDVLRIKATLRGQPVAQVVQVDLINEDIRITLFRPGQL